LTRGSSLSVGQYLSGLTGSEKFAFQQALIKDRSLEYPLRCPCQTWSFLREPYSNLGLGNSRGLPIEVVDEACDFTPDFQVLGEIQLFVFETLFRFGVLGVIATVPGAGQNPFFFYGVEFNTIEMFAVVQEL
jgi:hypothetical protein